MTHDHILKYLRIKERKFETNAKFNFLLLTIKKNDTSIFYKS